MYLVSVAACYGRHVHRLPSFPGSRPGESKRVTIRLDGEAIEAIEGEPVAAALIAAGKIALARSPKFHRPRGPSCFRAACDGCLARVDGAPNTMTCLTAAKDGMEIASQNTLGSRELDLLRMTDWFFPEGFNHHELFAGVPGVQQVMQIFARRVAGLGRIPESVAAPRAGARRELDVVVVGSGASGMAIALELAARGRHVDVLDDALTPGGSLRALVGEEQAWSAIVEPFGDAVRKQTIAMRTSTTAAGLYGDDLMVVGPTGARVVNARALVLASGAHDGVLPFESNDVPGVMSARAGGMLLARGVAPGEKIVVAIAEGGGPFGEAFARAGREAGLDVTVVHGVPESVSGSLRVKAVKFLEGKRTKTVKADCLLVDAPRAPAYELCEQAGATLKHRPFGFLPMTDAERRIRDGVWAIGEVAGTPLEPRAILREARKVADAIMKAQSSTSAPKSESPPRTATKSKVPSKIK
ncbi:MAG: Sarcosine oxidase alpha subunit [Myxococcaceae bacterium]|nr:Sarcosine oxidase alpha subunit [Myxococcaceae bacterium]